jgi:MFS family permease
MALAGAVFAVTDQVVWMMAAAIVGPISPSGKEVGPFLSVEQAILPQTAANRHRTGVFAAYNLVGSLATAVGALAVALPSLLGLAPVDGYRLLLWGYVAAALGLGILFARLSPSAEATLAGPDAARPELVEGRVLRQAHHERFSPALQGGGISSRPLGVYRSRAVVAKLAALFSLDAFAGGFIVQGLVAYWLNLRFGADSAALAAVFFGTNLLSAISFLAAAPLARRIGLLNTMVFTHLPSNVLLLAVPAMPTLELAVAVLLARSLLSQLDVPTRQSYTMAIIDPEDRAGAAGVMSVARNAAAAAAPAFAGAALATPALGLPFLLAGGLKIVYDLAVFAAFRHVRPPEELERARA